MPDLVATPLCLMAVIVDDDLDKQQVLPNPIPGSAMWSCSSTTTVHCTSSAEFVYNRRSPRPGEEYLVDLCGGKLVVEWFGMLDLVIHGSRGNVHVTLNDIAVVPEFQFQNVLSLGKITSSSDGITVVGNESGLSMLDGRVRFVRGSTGNYAQATRVPHAAAPSAALEDAAPEAAQHSAVRPLPKPSHIPTPQHPSWGEGGIFDCGSNACYHQIESAPAPPADMVYKCTRCGRLGHKFDDCCAPRRFEGNCPACGQYGHMKRDCIIALQSRHRAKALHW